MSGCKQDTWHDTALHYAAAKGLQEMTTLLLAFGAEPAAVNSGGERYCLDDASTSPTRGSLAIQHSWPASCMMPCSAQHTWSAVLLDTGDTPAALAAKSGHCKLAVCLEAVQTGAGQLPDRKPYLQHAQWLDTELRIYTSSLADALKASSAQHSSTCSTSAARVQEGKMALQKLLPALLRPPGRASMQARSGQTPIKQAAACNAPSNDTGEYHTQRPVAEAVEEELVHSSTPDSHDGQEAANGAIQILLAVCPAAAASDDGGLLQSSKPAQSAPQSEQVLDATSSGSSNCTASNLQEALPQHLDVLKTLVTDSRLRGWEGEGSQGVLLP